MDTSKILAFRHPSQAGLLLESLLHSLGRLPERARRVTDRGDLPGTLQRIAIRGAKQRQSWSAWRRDSSLWFFTSEVVATTYANLKRPALRICRYDEKGRLTLSEVWVNVPTRGWRQCAL